MNDVHSKRAERIKFLREFVIAWWECATIDEVCLQMGIDRRGASNLAAALRQKDIPLKRYPPRPKCKSEQKVYQSDYVAIRKMAECLQERFFDKQERCG